jgi:hypothetical protein
VVIFIAGENLVSVVQEKIGGGPLNIVVKGIVTDSITSLEISDHSITLNGEEIPLHESKRYNPFFNIEGISYDRFEENLQYFEKVLVELTPENSLTSFLSGRIDIMPQGSFQNIMKKKLDSGLKELYSGDIEKGVRLLKGVGIGLTPSGDDAIAGVLLALHIVQKITGWDLQQSISRIAEIAVSQNKFTNSFVHCAAQGMLFEKNKYLVQSLLSRDARKIKENVLRVLEIGHTSGADMAVGFLLTMKRMATAFNFNKLAV